MEPGGDLSKRSRVKKAGAKCLRRSRAGSAGTWGNNDLIYTSSVTKAFHRGLSAVGFQNRIRATSSLRIKQQTIRGLGNCEEQKNCNAKAVPGYK